MDEGKRCTMEFPSTRNVYHRCCCLMWWFPSPRLCRAIAPEGLHVTGEGCDQGRDDVRVSPRLWR